MKIIKKITLVLIISSLLFLSGCLDKIETHERETCLALTHYSETSVVDCKSQTECLSKMFVENLSSSKNIPKEIHNKNIIYKNNIASATYYFNKSSENIKVINNACYTRTMPKKIVDNVNDLFFYLANIFKYLDRSSKTSIEILKDYAIYLKNQDVHLISEEELYLDFIEINNNLNELADITIKETYVGNLKENAKKINEAAKELGFKETYISKVSYLDLFAYYYEFSEEVQEKEKKLPSLSLSTSYIFSKISNLMILEKINVQLSRTDKYNLFLLLDKHMGLKNSTTTEFKKLNNRIVKNLKQVFEKITELEEKIESEKEYLNEEQKIKHIVTTHEYEYQDMSFGKYLKILKALAINIEQNKITILEKEQKQKEELEECEIIIKEEKLKNNVFLRKLIETYEQEDNYVRKKEICEKIKNNYDVVECQKELLLVIEEKNDIFREYRFLEYEIIDDEECQNVLGLFEHRLNNHEKIKIINQIIEENKQLFLDYEKLKRYDLEKEIKISTLKEENKSYETLRNTQKIIDVDKKINNLNNLSKKIKEINDHLLEKYVAEKIKIEYRNYKYYLIINNPTSKEQNQIRIKTENVNFSEIKSNTQKLRITKDYITFYDVKKGENKYEIEYRNKQKITTNILDLRAGQSLMETRIENEVSGLKGTLNVGRAEIADKTKYVLDKNHTISFITEPINRIIYYKNIISKEKMFVEITETNEERYVVSERYKITNNALEKINGNLGLITINNEIVLVKKDQENIDTQIENNLLRINITLDVFETLIVDVYRMKEKEEIIKDMQKIASLIIQLQQSVFEEVREKAKTLEAPPKEIENYNLEDIKKMYLLETKINQIKEKQKNKEQTEDQINLLLYKMLETEPEYEKEINDLKKNMHGNIDQTYQKTLFLEKKIADDKREATTEQEQKLNKQFNSFLEIKEELKIDNQKINTLFKDYKLEETNPEKTIKEIEDLINWETKIITDHIYDKIRYVEKTNIKEIEKIKENIDWLYEYVSLKEMYDVNYYPNITSADGERLLKKAQFLETITLKEQILSFKENYEKQEYYSAQSRIPDITKQRINEIKTEKEFIEREINNIKKDAKEELNLYLQTRAQEENLETLALAKENYDKEQYLYVLFLLRNISDIEKNKIALDLETIVYFLIISLFIALFVYFKKEKKKDKTNINERKQKIIRHY